MFLVVTETFIKLNEMKASINPVVWKISTIFIQFEYVKLKLDKDPCLSYTGCIMIPLNTKLLKWNVKVLVLEEMRRRRLEMIIKKWYRQKLVSGVSSNKQKYTKIRFCIPQWKSLIKTHGKLNLF